MIMSVMVMVDSGKDGGDGRGGHDVRGRGGGMTGVANVAECAGVADGA